jgi:hypothetical protein
MTQPLVGDFLGGFWVGYLKGQFAGAVFLDGSMDFARVYYVDEPVVKWAQAQTFGNYILLRRNSNQQTLNHELTHVEQWHRYGFFGLGFALLYIFNLLRYGYQNNPLEVEARGREAGKPCAFYNPVAFSMLILPHKDSNWGFLIVPVLWILVYISFCLMW